MGGAVAYNPSDPVQTAFLAALAKGESAGGSGSLYQGTGGADLHSAPTDEYGFPQWGGFGNSHAAGTFQFQPGTWDSYAKTYGLNFGSGFDQQAAAWYLAQDTYAQKTGGSLSEALKSGDYTSVQSSLASVWPSVTGNGASKGLASNLANGIGVALPGQAGGISADTSAINPFLHPIQYLQDQFQRWGLLIVGAVLVVIALWYLLAQAGAVPSPTDVAKSAAKVAVLA
jgi:muramidase (phage lysozyme)